MSTRSRNVIIYIPVFNRKAVVLESIANMKAVKQAAHLRIMDDCSTEFQGAEIAALGDSGVAFTSHQDTETIRIAQLTEFLTSPYEYCYFTDSDTLHDPEFLDRAFFMLDRTGYVCGLYNTCTANHKDGVQMDIGDDIRLRRSLPGVSLFFTRRHAARMMDFIIDAKRFRPRAAREHGGWDWLFLRTFPHLALSTVSYVQHLYVGGRHARNGVDVALNPTPFLAQESPAVFARLGVDLPETAPT